MNEATAKLKDRWESVDLKVTNEGEKIILPADPNVMTVKEGIISLKRIEKAENQVYDVNEVVRCHFYDGMVALAMALKEIFGVAVAVKTPPKHFFDSEHPPQMVHVKTGPGIDDFIQVPYGRFKLPGIDDGFIETTQTKSRGIPMLAIMGQVKAKDKKVVMRVVKEAQKFAKEHSIYRSASIILDKKNGIDKGGEIDFSEPLQFFDPSLGNEIPIFNAETEELINVAIMSPLQQTQRCRDENIPLRRGILFEGPYGTGKTLTAKQVATIANQNGWTFILVKSPQALKFSLEFAKLYQPCVVFTEDIDRVVKSRNEGANDLINEIDGIVSKTDEIMTVLTTNFVEKIDKSMLRPGRLDTVVSIRPPEGETVARLIRFYAGELLDPKADLKSAVEKLSGSIPAAIAEAVQKSKLSMIYHDREQINGDDITTSAVGMENHMKLLDNANEGENEVDDLSTQIGAIVKHETEMTMVKMFKKAGIRTDRDEE